MSQSRRGSLVESIANVAIGYGVAVATQMAVLPLFGMTGRTQDHLAIAGVFSVVSVVRSYCVRRVSNWLTKETQHEKEAGS